MIPSAPYIAELADATRAIISCRDFCGDEAQTLKDWESKNRRLTDTERRIVRANADKEWGKWQKVAGVTKPISAAERAKISRDLSDE